MELVKGQNVVIAEAGSPRSVEVLVAWSAPSEVELDASAIVLDAEHKVLSNDHFVFFNQPTSPCGGVRHTAGEDGQHDRLHVQLPSLAPEAQSVVIALSVYDAQTRGHAFSHLSSAKVEVREEGTGSVLARFALDTADAVETAMLMAEVYRHGGGWKVRAIGQGYAEGLRGFATDFGVTGLTETPSSAPLDVPPAAPAAVAPPPPPSVSEPTPPPEAPTPERSPFNAQDTLDTRLDKLLQDVARGVPSAKARQMGLGAQMNDQHEVGLQYHIEAAKLGDIESMYDVGCIVYERGELELGVSWWECAADSGHPDAARNIGAHYIRQGDVASAEQWFVRQADLGDADGYAALTQVADERGDDAAEFEWSRRGAEADHPFCLMRHGQLLAQRGENQPHLLPEALRLLERSAELSGDPDAMFLAGITCGQMQRMDEARSWLLRADAKGHPRARLVMDRYGL